MKVNFPMARFCNRAVFTSLNKNPRIIAQFETKEMADKFLELAAYLNSSGCFSGQENMNDYKTTENGCLVCTNTQDMPQVNLTETVKISNEDKSERCKGVCLVNPETFEVEHAFSSIRKAAEFLKISYTTFMKMLYSPIDSLDVNGYAALLSSMLTQVKDENDKISYDTEEIKTILQEKQEIRAVEVKKLKAKKQAKFFVVLDAEAKTVSPPYSRKKFREIKEEEIKNGTIVISKLEEDLRQKGYYIVDEKTIVARNSYVKDEEGNLNQKKCAKLIKILKENK